jgi:hypothetical protein
VTQTLLETQVRCWSCYRVHLAPLGVVAPPPRGAQPQVVIQRQVLQTLQSNTTKLMPPGLLFAPPAALPFVDWHTALTGADYQV